MRQDETTIGRLAHRAGVGVETIRFYEREGLLAPPPRTAGGYRIYPESAVSRIRFIQRAKELGFALAEIRGLLALSARAGTECEDVRARAEAKIADVDARIRDLQRVRDALARLAGDCAAGRTIEECPVLDALRTDAVEET